MNIKVHTTGGGSFKDLAAYLLYTQDGALSREVGWTETRNLATKNPEAAWRVMAATAMNQADLKRSAGISASGRKPGGSVLHISISWKDEEAQDRNLNRQEMMRLVDTVLANYGAVKPKRSQFADEHQALVVCHEDKKHPHVHVVINRTHPTHGVYLPDGNDWLKMSGTALQYERESGRIWSPKRELNWSKRERQELANYHEQPRNIWQAKQDGAHPATIEQVTKDQKSKDSLLYQKSRSLKKQHRLEWKKLSEKHQDRTRLIETTIKKEAGQTIVQLRKEYLELWTKRLNEKEAAYGHFLNNENSLIGRFQNRFQAIDLRRVFTARDRLKALSQIGHVMTSASKRQKAFVTKQSRIDKKLEQAQSEAEQKSINKAFSKRKKAIKENRDIFQQERLDLIKTQHAEKSSLRDLWKQRNQERRIDLEDPELAEAKKKAAAIRAMQQSHKSKSQRKGRGI